MFENKLKCGVTYIKIGTLFKGLFCEDKSCEHLGPKLCVRRVFGSIAMVVAFVGLFHPEVGEQQYIHFLYVSAALLVTCGREKTLSYGYYLLDNRHVIMSFGITVASGLTVLSCIELL